MQTATVDENSLKLTGNKIKLTTRPIENYSTASSRCALLGRSYSRPVSAVPLLNLNYNEFEVHTNTRRPLSADFPLGRFKDSSYRSNLSLSQNRYPSHYPDGETSMESSEETDSGLPSSQLLHNLLSEPLCSWRNGIRCKPFRKTKILKKPSIKFRSDNSDSNETPSAGSDTSSSAESVGVKQHKIKEVDNKSLPSIDLHKNNFYDHHHHGEDQIEAQVQDEFADMEKETLMKQQLTIDEQISQRSEIIQLNPDGMKPHNDSASNPMPLLPGLKTKPPLPKKPDSNVSKSFRKANSPHSSHDDPNADTKTNFEHIMENFHLMVPKTSWNHQEDLSDSKYYEENINPKQADGNNVSSTSTLDSDTIDVKFQTWVQEEQKVTNEIMESEWNTDISLHKLKLQNQKDEKEFKELENQENVQRNDEAVSNTNRASKVVNFQPFDVQELKRDYDKRRKNFPAKNFIKQNIKLTASPNRKKLPNNEAPKSKNFVATPMKSFLDYTETNAPLDVESWMSSNSGKSSPKIRTTTDGKANENLCSKPTSYFDFLNEIEELQETCKNNTFDDIPQHDKDEPMTDQGDSNTYDDIVSILQVLEEQDKKSQMKMESMKEIVSHELSPEKEERRDRSRGGNFAEPIDNHDGVSHMDFDYQLSNEPTVEKFRNDCNCSNLTRTRDQEQPSRSSLNSSTNLNDIFSYLDEVDKNCKKSLACAKESIQITSQMMENNIKLDTIPKLEELLAHTNVELSHVIIDLSLRLKEKSSSIALLQKELSTFRNQVAKMTKDTNEIVKQRLKTQKEDYENVVKRHQKFIDQLIADKKTLNQQSEGLIHEMKVLEDRYNSNLKAAEHKHKVELQKVKEMHVAGEKIRRDRWIDTKTQKIKELTVKGLEPELDKMAARHQQELTDLRSLHKREIEDLELRAARKMQQQCETLREQLIAEREKALAHERDVLRQRYEQLVESEEHNYQEQRRRLLAEHANRISECEERENAAVVERDRAIKQAQIEFEDKLQAIVRRHTTELSVLKEKTELEIEAFRNSYKKQAAVQLAEKESQIRERYRKERDKEIEAVIERLEMESNDNKSQIEQSTENRIRRLREKFETEIKDLELSEKEATGKYSETKTKLLEAEDLVISLKASGKQMEMQLHETKEISDKLSKERNKIKEVIKDEMKQEIQTLEKELQELRNGKDKELQQVYARVKVAVARKDETISELTRDHTALQEKCVYLENMLEQQRKEYLIK